MTFIEWVLNPDNKTRGITVNSKTGCLNHTPEGLCLGGMFPCYAFKLANGRLRPLYCANQNFPLLEGGALVQRAIFDPFYPRYWPGRLEQIRKIKKPTGIFLDDMSDWMGDYWPEEWTEQELQVMRDCPQHRFYTLTKQPQNLIKFSPFPDNCYVGVTATDAKSFLEACRGLEGIEAKVKYISLEPFLDYIGGLWAEDWFKSGISNWLIIGACTGTKAEMSELMRKYPELTLMPYGNKWTLQPKIEWVEEISKACVSAGISLFMKDNLTPLLKSRHIIVRQEMPK